MSKMEDLFEGWSEDDIAEAHKENKYVWEECLCEEQDFIHKKQLFQALDKANHKIYEDITIPETMVGDIADEFIQLILYYLDNAEDKVELIGEFQRYLYLD